jgi:hypothetical protein
MTAVHSRPVPLCLLLIQAQLLAVGYATRPSQLCCLPAECQPYDFAPQHGELDRLSEQIRGHSRGIGAIFCLPVPARLVLHCSSIVRPSIVQASLMDTFHSFTGGASTYLGGVIPDQQVEKSANKGLAMMKSLGRRLAISSWNIAAINNNPWEYWISYPEEPEYDQLMKKIEDFILQPGDKDLPVSQVFTEDMFIQLESRMTGVGWKSVRSYWEKDFRDRKIVSSFLKVRTDAPFSFISQIFSLTNPFARQDPLLGSKRLASMPDRITNTINVDGGQVYRPTVINMYEGDLSSMDKWWAAWESFMFDTPLGLPGKEGIEEKIPYQLLQMIKKSKYPDITEEEEADSLPLQTMCGAIFDSILVHMMNTVATSPQAWQSLKSTMVENLNKKKNPHTIEILERSYSDSDIITLQEVAYSFIDQIRASKLGQKFHIVAPMNIDSVRDQNSVIALNRETFPHGPGIEISSLVEKSFPVDEDVPVATGDILAITAETKHGVPLVIASFHGDTNGLATKPVLTAVLKAMVSDSKLAGHRLIFGMDANTYENAKPGKQQDVLDFGKHFVAQGVSTTMGFCRPLTPRFDLYSLTP